MTNSPDPERLGIKKVHTANMRSHLAKKSGLSRPD
jgi:hypothetical protein